MIVRTLSEVFAFVTIWEMNDAEFALVAGNRAFRTPIETVRRRFHEPAVRADLYRIGLGRVERVLGHFITAGGALRDWSRTAELHTDDAAQLEFSAPRHLYADEADRISDSLYGIQRSLLDETIAGGPDAAGTRSLTGAFERMQAARTARADTIRRFRGHANGVQLAEELFQIYHADPESIETFRLIMDVVSRLRGGVPAPYQKRSEALLRQFVYLRPPIWAPRTGATLSELARTITGLAAEVAARDGTEAALPYLREAHELAPADGEIVRRLAGALVRIDDSEAALRLLSEAVGSGSIAARELAEDPTFESIRDDPRFLALTHPRP